MRCSRLLVLSLALLLGCRSALPAGERIGEPMHASEPLAFAVVDTNPTAYFDRTLLVEAEVTAVCASKGCWMQVADGEHTAMVRWESGCGGAYAFPADAVGKRVLIQGSFYPQVISEEDAAHMEGESGGAVEIARDGYEFNASAVLIRD